MIGNSLRPQRASSNWSSRASPTVMLKGRSEPAALATRANEQRSMLRGHFNGASAPLNALSRAHRHHRPGASTEASRAERGTRPSALWEGSCLPQRAARGLRSDSRALDLPAQDPELVAKDKDLNLRGSVGAMVRRDKGRGADEAPDQRSEASMAAILSRGAMLSPPTTSVAGRSSSCTPRVPRSARPMRRGRGRLLLQAMGRPHLQVRWAAPRWAGLS